MDWNVLITAVIGFIGGGGLIYIFNYKGMSRKVNAVSAYISAVSSVLLLALMGFWYIPAITLTLAMKPVNNRTYWLEMGCFASIFITATLLKYV